MKKIIQLICLVLLSGLIIPLSSAINKDHVAGNNSSKTIKKTKKKTSTVDFTVYNSTSSTGWVYLYNTVTDEGTYYTIPANTPSNGTVVGQVTANDDIYTGTVQLNQSTLRTIQLYFNYETNVNYLYGTDMAIGCGACAFVRID